MFAWAISQLIFIFGELFDILEQFFDTFSGAWPFVFTCLTIMYIIRFLLHPLGLGSSDMAKKATGHKSDKAKNNKSNSKEE